MIEVHQEHRLIRAFALVCCACSGDGGGTGPSGSVAATDLIGTWTDGNRTWTLSAGSAIVNSTTVIQVGGPATLVHNNHPSFGLMSARAGVSGTVVVGLSGLMLAESYSVSTPLFPSPSNSCYIDTEAQLTLSGHTLTGTVAEHDGCNGVRLRDSSSRVTLRRN